MNASEQARAIDFLHDIAITLNQVNGKHYRAEVEFEEQCALRGWAFKGLWRVNDSGTVTVAQ